MLVSVINKRGRILYLSTSDADALVAKGMAQFFPVPKQNYYPQFDEGINDKRDPIPTADDGVDTVDLIAIDIL